MRTPPITMTIRLSALSLHNAEPKCMEELTCNQQVV